MKSINKNNATQVAQAEKFEQLVADLFQQGNVSLEHVGLESFIDRFKSLNELAGKYNLAKDEYNEFIEALEGMSAYVYDRGYIFSLFCDWLDYAQEHYSDSYLKKVADTFESEYEDSFILYGIDEIEKVTRKDDRQMKAVLDEIHILSEKYEDVVDKAYGAWRAWSRAQKEAIYGKEFWEADDLYA